MPLMSRDAREDDLDRIRATYERYDTDRSGLWDLRNRGYARLARERDALLVRLLCASVPKGGRVLDLGCGDGYLAGIARAGGLEANWLGLDLRGNAVAEARARFPWAEFVEASADSIPAADDSFDAVLVANLFSSLPSRKLASAVAIEIARVLRPGGWLVWYDMRYPSPGNREVHPLGRRAIAALFPTWQMELRSFTLLPPLARRLGPLTSALYPLLHAVPGLRSHLIGRLQRTRS
jgi:ubiquinone/menaquinone biosynthesis C-methylase UbiE